MKKKNELNVRYAFWTLTNLCLQVLMPYLKTLVQINLRIWVKKSGEKFNILRGKGVFPYKYIDSVNRLNENKVPPKSAFYSKTN